ncbi:MAG: NAD(P)/FAD-dependent oxidoreductase [Maritimibacter sp.]
MVDVTIRGAGAFGLSIAFVMAQRGVKVRVVDPNGPGGGASGGIVGALAPHAPENWIAKKAFQFDSLDKAEAFWRSVEAIGGTSSGYGRTGRLQAIDDEHALKFALEREENAKSLWQGRYHWNVIKSPGAWAPISPTGYFIHDTLTARMFPRRACAALAAAIIALGGEITTDARDQGPVVWATGAAGLVDLSQDIGQTVGGAMKGQAALLRFDAKTKPQIYAGGVHIVAHADGTVAIGSTSERDFLNATDTDEQLDQVIERARAVVPALQNAPVIERWAGLRPRAKTRAPMLGEWPGRSGHFVANGGFKIGFGIAPAVGGLMADLVLDQNDQIPDHFRVDSSLKARPVSQSKT